MTHQELNLAELAWALCWREYNPQSGVRYLFSEGIFACSSCWNRHSEGENFPHTAACEFARFKRALSMAMKEFANESAS